MKTLFLVLFLLGQGAQSQFLNATIALATFPPEQKTIQLKKNRDRPRLKTYHRPVKVFAPIKAGREDIWTVFTLVLILIGHVGLLFFSPNGESRYTGVILAFLLLVEIVILLLHPIIWLIRWLRMLHWKMSWKRRYRACPGQ